MKDLKIIKLCRLCGSKNINPFFDLGKQPLANSLLKNSKAKEKFYPLSLSFCINCGLVQLNETIDPKKLFSQYLWISGTSPSTKIYAEEFCSELLKRAQLKKDDYILEVASNDGTFLIPFLRKKIKVLGVDPAKNIAKMALEKGVPTEALFFGEKVAKNLRKKYGEAKVVFARNVLPHVAATRDFIKGLAEIVSSDGVVAIEFHYAGVILKELHYDSIYHEHLCYFSLKTIEKLLNEHELFIFDLYNESPISGGSIVVYAKKGKVLEKSIVKKIRAEEMKNKINKLISWQNFAKRAQEHRAKLLEIISKKIKENKIIIGWGASARSSTLLNFCGIGSDKISSIIDLNPLKQNLFTAGTHIPILGREEVMRKNPDSVVILGWNFAKEIIADLKRIKFKGDCIIPLPNKPINRKI